MEILAGLSGLLIGVVAAWQFGRGYAAAQMSRLRAQLQEQVAYWQDETERARANAARISEQAAAFAAGCQQGREDILSLAQVLAHPALRTDNDLVTGDSVPHG
jgi:hypothetical protein